MKTAQHIALAWALAAAASANTLSVTATTDTGTGSLRAQIAAAASGDTIAISATGTIALTTGEIAITGKNLDITGPGAGTLTITTNATSRALKFTNSRSSISGITFNNCKSLAGAIDTGGAIAVDNFTAGGSANLTTINDCAFTNSQSGWGGALDVFNGGLVMNRCTFSGNSCTGLAFSTPGGGAALSLGATVASAITNCTFSGNSQNGVTTGQPGGGAIYNYGAVPVNPPPVIIEHCTFAGNLDASGAAGAIKGNYTASYHTLADVKNCLLVNNQAPATVMRNFSGNPTGSLAASYISLGGNVTDEATTSTQFMTAISDGTGQLSLAASVSSSLALNGGSITTHAITRGSPAQRRAQASSVSTDQRGAPRHSIADAGAFELIEPELRMTSSDVPIAESGTLNLGSTLFDSPITKSITLTNTQASSFSSGPLILGNVSVPHGFSLTDFPVTSLANGQSATFSVTLHSSIPGLLDVPLSFTGNDSFNPSSATNAMGQPNSHSIRLTALVTDTITHWREQHFGSDATNPDIAGDNANPTGDGVVNLMKYALGLDPMVSGITSSGVTVGPDPAGYLKMSVIKNPAATDLSLAVEVTGDLNTSSSWNPAGATIDLNTPTLLQAHDNTPISAASSRFIRLKVSQP